MLLAVSGGLLWDLGYNYDGLQGSPLTKIHPFTYFVFAALAWRALQSGDAVRLCAGLPRGAAGGRLAARLHRPARR